MTEREAVVPSCIVLRAPPPPPHILSDTVMSALTSPRVQHAVRVPPFGWVGTVEVDEDDNDSGDEGEMTEKERREVC